MNTVEIQAHRAMGAVVRDMLRADPNCGAVAVVDAQGMLVEWVDEEHGPLSRGWFFNEGGWSANKRNAMDIRRWCVG